MDDKVEKVKGKKKRRFCRICKTTKGVMQRHNLNMCRRCFKEIAEKLGFKKYS